MNRDDAELILLECFLALPDENLANLAYHRKRGTRICCGDDAATFIDKSGGG